MRTAIMASLLVLAGCGAKLPEIDNPTPVLPDAEAPTVFTRAYGLTESPDGKIRVFAKEERDYTHLYEMRKQADGSWSDPVQLEFPARIKLTTPSFSHSDGALYYASDADIFERGQRDANLWRVEPTEDGWGEPKPLDPSINTGADQLNPAMGKDGRLYFTDNGYDSSGAHDIFMAERGGADDGEWTITAMPDGFNSGRAEAHLAVTPDGDRLFFYSHRSPKLGSVDIWTAERSGDGWQMPQNLGAPVNTPGIDFGPGLSGDGSILFFSRDGELMMISLAAALGGVGSVEEATAD